jgi:hypothetical protein
LDLEYLGTTSGDNLFGPFTSSAAENAGPRAPGLSTALLRLVVLDARVHGSFALPYGSYAEFRVGRAEYEQSPSATGRATLHEVVVDMQGATSLRAQGLVVELGGDHVRVMSTGRTSVDVPGGGSLLDRLALTAEIGSTGGRFDVHGGEDERAFVLAGQWQPQRAELSLDAQETPLRALGALAAPGGGERPMLGLENATLSMHATLALDRPSLRADFDIDGKLAGVDVLHPAIDTMPWRNQAGAVRARGRVDLANSRIDVTEGSLSLLASRMSLSGWIELGRVLRGGFSLATPRDRPLSCSALLLGQPKPVQDVLAGLELEGYLGFSADAEFDTSDLEDMKLDLSIDPLCRVKSEPRALAAILPTLQNPDAPAAAAVSTDLPLGSFHPDFTPLAIMSRYLPHAFVTAEDSQFFVHQGFDVDMIRHALAQDLENRSFDRGASTITQQLAKNLFLSHQRTLARKLEEAVFAWRLQRLLSRERILELYLNIIEMGPGIRGVRQAARAYFTRGVSNLTPLEAVHLAALTPNPHVLARRFRDGKIDEGWRQRLYDLLGSMRRHGRLSPAELAEARASKLVLRDRTHELPPPQSH